MVELAEENFPFLSFRLVSFARYPQTLAVPYFSPLAAAPESICHFNLLRLFSPLAFCVFFTLAHRSGASNSAKSWANKEIE